MSANYHRNCKEIAYCLMNQRAPVWIPALAHQIQTQSEMNDTGGNRSQQILNASIRCLKLLVDVMNFSFPLPAADDHTERPTTTDPSRVEKWKELAGGLRAWHSNRPQGLEPLVEVDNSEKCFSHGYIHKRSWYLFQYTVSHGYAPPPQ